MDYLRGFPFRPTGRKKILKQQNFIPKETRHQGNESAKHSPNKEEGVFRCVTPINNLLKKQGKEGVEPKDKWRSTERSIGGKNRAHLRWQHRQRI